MSTVITGLLIFSINSGVFVSIRDTFVNVTLPKSSLSIKRLFANSDCSEISFMDISWEEVSVGFKMVGSRESEGDGSVISVVSSGMEPVVGPGNPGSIGSVITDSAGFKTVGSGESEGDGSVISVVSSGMEPVIGPGNPGSIGSVITDSAGFKMIGSGESEGNDAFVSMVSSGIESVVGPENPSSIGSVIADSVRFEIVDSGGAGSM